ncbi:hypothetical protein J3F83DRAFT_730009 [Trichoderma novae-zelandiae]
MVLSVDATGRNRRSICPGFASFAANTLRRVKQGKEVLGQLAPLASWLIPSGLGQSEGDFSFTCFQRWKHRRLGRWSRFAPNCDHIFQQLKLGGSAEDRQSSRFWFCQDVLSTSALQKGNCLVNHIGSWRSRVGHVRGFGHAPPTPSAAWRRLRRASRLRAKPIRLVMEYREARVPVPVPVHQRTRSHISARSTRLAGPVVIAHAPCASGGGYRCFYLLDRAGAIHRSASLD